MMLTDSYLYISVEELLYRLRYGLLATIFIPCAHSVSMGGNGDFEK